jgi:hypothetical protein
MYSGEEAGLDNDIIKMVSPHADEGQDATLGILSRNAHKRGRHPILYMVGLMYTYMDNREYGDYEENQKHMVTLNYTPEFHVREYKLMFALENNLHYWHNRGYYVTTLPQLRWEFIPFWVIEIGVKVPVAGENNYRYIIGINQGKG